MNPSNQHSHQQHNRASSGMNSVRSNPDHERPHVKHSKPIYERNSITEGRPKKKKKSMLSKGIKDGNEGNNRDKILPLLISKQRK